MSRRSGASTALGLMALLGIACAPSSFSSPAGTVGIPVVVFNYVGEDLEAIWLGDERYDIRTSRPEGNAVKRFGPWCCLSIVEGQQRMELKVGGGEEIVLMNAIVARPLPVRAKGAAIHITGWKNIIVLSDKEAGELQSAPVGGLSGLDTSDSEEKSRRVEDEDVGMATVPSVRAVENVISRARVITGSSSGVDNSLPLSQALIALAKDTDTTLLKDRNAAAQGDWARQCESKARAHGLLKSSDVALYCVLELQLPDEFDRLGPIARALERAEGLESFAEAIDSVPVSEWRQWDEVLNARGWFSPESEVR